MNLCFIFEAFYAIISSGNKLLLIFKENFQIYIKFLKKLFYRASSRKKSRVQALRADVAKKACKCIQIEKKSKFFFTQ